MSYVLFQRIYRVVRGTVTWRLFVQQIQFSPATLAIAYAVSAERGKHRNPAQARSGDLRLRHGLKPVESADRPLHQSDDAVDQTVGGRRPVRPGKRSALGELALEFGAGIYQHRAHHDAALGAYLSWQRRQSAAQLFDDVMKSR